MIAAAWEVEPEASSDEKAEVRLPNGRLSMNGEMSQQVTERPSSARTCVGDVCRLPVPFRANHVAVTCQSRGGHVAVLFFATRWLRVARAAWCAYLDGGLVGDNKLASVARHLIVHAHLQRLEQGRLAYLGNTQCGN